MRSNIPKLMAYYKACYQADNRSLEINSFLSTKVEHVHWLDSAELLAGKLEMLPLDPKIGQPIHEHMFLNYKEKELFIGTFFLLGKAEINSMGKKKVQRICAPLLLSSADVINDNDSYYLLLNSSPNILNPAVLRLLEKQRNPEQAEDNFSSIYDQVHAEMPAGWLGFDECFRIEKVLSNLYPQQDFSLIHQFPKLIDKKAINTKIRQASKEEVFSFVNAMSLGVLPKSKASKGVLSELEALCHAIDYSWPVYDLIPPKTQRKTKPNSSIIFSPANLSAPQQAILHSANNHSITQVVGPPGTGKSFTIAALAIDAMSRGQSVLISSKYDQAVDVVANKIEQDLGLKNIVVRSGISRSYKKTLGQKLQQIIFGIGLNYIRQEEVQRIFNKLNEISQRIFQLEQQLLLREKQELKHGKVLSTDQNGFSSFFKRFFIERKVKRGTSYWNTVDEWERLINQRTHLVLQYAEKRFQHELYKAMQTDRSTFINLMEALKQNKSGHSFDYLRDTNFSLLFKALPIWLSNTKDVSQLLPLRENLFDLVIIDEASQCDIASAMPILQRGKRAVIVGDPEQLRHLSFLSKKRQRNLQAQFELKNLQGDILLNYREKSLLDMVSRKVESQDQVHFLNEHYRSQADIIDFSNNAFYQGALNVMTKRPGEAQIGNVSLHVTTGKRTPKGYNEEEAQQLMQVLQQILETAEPFSIGILSPFRAQVDYLKKQIQTHISLDKMQKHRILIGTPYHFQGEERDVMLLSMAIDDEVHPSTLRYLDRNDVLNVSITRAKKQQHVFISGNPKQWNQDILLVRYLASINSLQLQDDQKPSPVLLDPFTQEIENELWQIGIQDIVHHQVIAGFEVDLFFQIKNQQYAIDLIGYPGLMERAIPPDKFQMLRRLGIKLLVIPYSEWVLEKERCLKQLQLFLMET